MQGRDKFTEAEASRVRFLLYKKIQHTGKEWQQPIRKELRDMGFYISDFGGHGFTVDDFDRLVHNGRIKIVP